VHRELSCAPVERFATAPEVLRPSPSSDALHEAFRLEATRRQRQSDGTISIEGVRFEVPARLRHFRDVLVRYARWDLSRVDLVDPRHGTLLAPLSFRPRRPCRRPPRPRRTADQQRRGLCGHGHR
jgi:hypothetical protein